MPGQDPSFWELPFDPGDLEDLPEEVFRAPSPDGGGPSAARAEALAGLAEVVRTSLTDKQRQLVEAYFYEGISQAEIAARFGISQQVVSRQLFGVVRNGRRVGGAMARLRRICLERGWDPERWV
jgi:DNA-directed RNA polymerase specialized sigma24 family protein